jgi:hypothetical protein
MLYACFSFSESDGGQRPFIAREEAEKLKKIIVISLSILQRRKILQHH